MFPNADVHPRDIAFVFCIEGNAIEQQAVLLAESIRRFGGAFAGAAIVAVNARPNLPISERAERRLADLDVVYVCEALNTTGHPYLTINRILASDWAEANLDREYLVALDSDVLIVAPPSFVAADCGVRPVDVKGSASSGADDPLDAYWAAMCAFGGIALEALGFVTATIDGARVRASYNGGFCIVRRSAEIFAETRRIFERSFADDLRPFRDAARSIFASTGDVGAVAREWWGSSQAALSVAIHARSHRVTVYDDRYNIPLHALPTTDAGGVAWRTSDPVLVHYHYLARPEFRADFLARLAAVGVGPDVRSWLRSELEAAA